MGIYSAFGAGWRVLGGGCLPLILGNTFSGLEIVLSLRSSSWSHWNLRGHISCVRAEAKTNSMVSVGLEACYMPMQHQNILMGNRGSLPIRTYYDVL